MPNKVRKLLMQVRGNVGTRNGRSFSLSTQSLDSYISAHASYHTFCALSPLNNSLMNKFEPNDAKKTASGKRDIYIE